MALSTGTRLGPYEILAAVGAGGMGEVYKACDTRLNRIVAIKVLLPHFTSEPDSKHRFDREARAIAALSHPHICSIFDVGHQDGTGFLVMEYLDGETLAQRLGGASCRSIRLSVTPSRSPTRSRQRTRVASSIAT